MPEDQSSEELELEKQRLKAEIDRQDAEIALRREELKTKLESDRRSIWFSSPLIIAVLSAIFGLLGTGVGAALQGYWNTELERQKFESSLIQNALETDDKDEAAKNLLFLVKAGIIQHLDGAKIEGLANNPSQLPILKHYHRAVAEGLMTIKEAKEILKGNGYYNGEINDIDDNEFVDAVRKFQKDKSVGPPDGLLGPVTASELRKLKK